MITREGKTCLKKILRIGNFCLENSHFLGNSATFFFKTQNSDHHNAQPTEILKHNEARQGLQTEVGWILCPPTPGGRRGRIAYI